MKYFIVEGNLKSFDPIDDTIMKEHMDYSGKAMKEGSILMTFKSIRLQNSPLTTLMNHQKNGLEYKNAGMNSFHSSINHIF